VTRIVEEAAVKLSANRLVMLMSGAGVIGAFAPDPVLLLTAHVVLLLGGIEIVRALEPTRA
jgi:hypothetical protein